jgi:hypothetical protein
LLKHFTSAEITLPIELEELKDMDVYLPKFHKIINEDIWLQVVNSRQYQPAMGADGDENYTKTVQLLKNDMDAILSTHHKSATSRAFIVQLMSHQLSGNLKRIAQSIARAEMDDNLKIEHFKTARGLILDNLQGFFSHPRIKVTALRMSETTEDPKFSIIQTELINNPHSTVNAIYNSIKSLKQFEDIYALQKYMDWLKKNGRVIEEVNKRYVWV